MSFAVEIDKKRVVYKLKSNSFSIVPKIPKYDAVLATLPPKDVYGLEKKCSVYYADTGREKGFRSDAESLIRSGHSIELQLDEPNNKVEIKTINDLDKFYEKVLKPSEPKKK